MASAAAGTAAIASSAAVLRSPSIPLRTLRRPFVSSNCHRLVNLAPNCQPLHSSASCHVTPQLSSKVPPAPHLSRGLAKLPPASPNRLQTSSAASTTVRKLVAGRSSSSSSSIASISTNGSLLAGHGHKAFIQHVAGVQSTSFPPLCLAALAPPSVCKPDCAPSPQASLPTLCLPQPAGQHQPQSLPQSPPRGLHPPSCFNLLSCQRAQQVACSISLFPGNSQLTALQPLFLKRALSEGSRPGFPFLATPGRRAADFSSWSTGLRAQAGQGEGRGGMAPTRRFAILQTGRSSPYTQQKYGSYGDLFVDLLREEGEEWEVFDVMGGRHPTEEEIEDIDGFVITGSASDAHGSEEWILQLCRTLRHIVGRKKRTLGVCFGHQVLSRALGGTTGRASVGWEIGIKQIPVSSLLAEAPYGEGLPPVLRILEIHQDQVLSLPPGARLLGSSPKTPVEIFALEDHVLGIQGHPEFRKDIVKELIESRMERGVIPESVGREALVSLENLEESREELISLCKSFLKRK